MTKATKVKGAPIENPVAPGFEADELYEVQPVMDGMVRVVFTTWHHSPRDGIHERRVSAHMLVHVRSLPAMIQAMQHEVERHPETRQPRARPALKRVRRRA